MSYNLKRKNYYLNLIYISIVRSFICYILSVAGETDYGEELMVACIKFIEQVGYRETC